MELKVSSKSVAAALKNSFSRSSVLQVTEYVLLRAFGTQLSITTCDFGIGQLTEYVSAEVIAEGAALVKQQQLKAALSGQTQDVEMYLRDKELRITTSRGSYTAPTLPWQEFPLQPDPEVVLDNIDPEVIASGVRNCLRSVGIGVTPQCRNNIYFDGVNKAVVATDGRSISLYDIKKEFTPFSLPGLNAKSALQFANRAKEAQTAKINKYDSPPDRLILRGDDFEAVIHLDDREKYFDWTPLLKQLDNAELARFTITPKELLDAANRISHFSFDKGKDTVISIGINNSNEITIRSGLAITSHGSGVEKIGGEVQKKPIDDFQISFSYQIISKILADFDAESTEVITHNVQTCSFRESDSLVHVLALMMV